MPAPLSVACECLFVKGKRPTEAGRTIGPDYIALERRAVFFLREAFFADFFLAFFFAFFAISDLLKFEQYPERCGGACHGHPRRSTACSSIG